MVWLYVWGAVMCAGLNASIDGGDSRPHWLGALAWPVIMPVAFLRRVGIKYLR